MDPDLDIKVGDNPFSSPWESQPSHHQEYTKVVFSSERLDEALLSKQKEYESKQKESETSYNKLKSKYDEMEENFKTQEEKWLSEKNFFNQLLSRKTEQIDTMRVKLNRYEFALKEAIIFLSKPIDRYSSWLQNGGYLDQPSRSKNPSAPVVSSSPAQLASSKQRKVDLLETKGEIISSSLPSLDQAQWDAVNKPISADDVPNLECIRLALNYLRSTQATVNNVITERTATASCDAIKEESYSEIQDISATTKEPAHDENSNIKSDTKNSHSNLNGDSQMAVYSNKIRSQIDHFNQRVTDNSIGGYSSTLSNLENGPISQKMVIRKTAEKADPVLADDDDEGDLALGAPDLDKESVASTSQASKSRASTVKCQNCIDLMLRIDHLQDQVSYLKRDVHKLGADLAEERSTKERLQLSKDILDQEIEELTAQMFDQANKMVMDEAKLREHFENSNHVLKGELKDLFKKFASRGQELKDLKRCLVALDTAKQRSMTSSSRRSSISGAPNLLGISSGLPSTLRDTLYSTQQIGSFLSSRIGPDNSLVPFIPVDAIICGEFKDFIKVVATLNTQSATYHAMGPLLNTVFIKRCLVEDVEPCLLYSYQQPAAGIYFKNATSMPSSYKKKLIEAVMRCGCEIKYYWSSKEDLYLNGGSSTEATVNTPQEAHSPQSASSNESTSIPKKKCSCCNVIKDCDYKLRFTASGTIPTSEWSPLCRFCRDRVVCVSDFFAYVNHMKLGMIGPGKVGYTILGMFRHIMWLKRRMALARVGSMALFEENVLAAFDPQILSKAESEDATLENLIQLV